MEIIENLKKLGKKENWRYLVLVIWLLIGIVIIQLPGSNLFPIIGIIIFLPFLTFLMFLFLLSLISKKDITEYETWKILLFLLISLPIMLLISIVLVVLFAFSVISYFFFTSWFMLYACYLSGKKVDMKLHRFPSYRPILRTIFFFGGLTLSLYLLYLFIIGPSLIDYTSITTIEIPQYFNIAYIIVGGIIIGFSAICIFYLFKKIFNAWLGIFFILTSIYTLFLVLKIFISYYSLQTGEERTSTFWGNIGAIGMILADVFIILYSVSTLMGSKAEILNQKSKRIGLDTVIIWLVFSKVAYEFIANFPYDLFSAFQFPFSDFLSILNNDLINLVKNIAVFAFFVLVFILLGIYEIRKYVINQKSIKEEVKVEVRELLSTEPSSEKKTIGEEDESSNLTQEVEKPEDISIKQENEDNFD
ncbi:MAG: hypothetical protein ACFFB0_14150 [Promethearchaeota archaeon]